MLESKFQAQLIKDIKLRFPDSIVLKNDCNYIQGMPDLTVLYRNHWAFLECKQAGKASHRPNQDYYISRANEMSYGAFVSPENVGDVLNEMARAFES